MIASPGEFLTLDDGEKPPSHSFSKFGILFFGAGEDCFRGLLLEVSLALVGVASPAYFQ